ncbi:MAG: enoyl-CoA hydratase/isomerase family protein [Chloroflexi bacterium]|nr:enoyl-CoA hydratase/isomerase family protein [Chloroflexota bacterium]
METRDFSFLQVTVRDGVAAIKLNRPPVNALSKRFLAEIQGALETCASDEDVRAIVIGTGLAKTFSAGADLTEMKGLQDEGARSYIEQGQALFSLIESVRQPVIAAVSGVALGGGCELAMACDLRVAGQSARFGQPEVDLGLVPGWGGTQRLPRLVGRTLAMEMMLTGEPIPAEQALAVGLVNRVVPDDHVADEALRMACTLASKSAVAVSRIKHAVHRGAEMPLHKGLELERGLFMEARQSRDAQEGISAFLEKRPPRFAGE